MKKDAQKKFPRTEVIENQKERARKVLKLDEEALKSVRGGGSIYGLPPPDENPNQDLT
jgi:hypothetical protein